MFALLARRLCAPRPTTKNAGGAAPTTTAASTTTTTTTRTRTRPSLLARRGLASQAAGGGAQEAEVGASDQFDVVVVGGGPAGLSAALRLRQLSAAAGRDLRVCVVEKAAEVGAHTLSGAVIEPRALNELLPDWRERGAPLTLEAGDDHFAMLLNERRAVPFPVVPPQMHNKGNYVVRLGEVVAWLGRQAEEAGVELYPGFAAADVLFRSDGSVGGVVTRAQGVGRDGRRKPSFEAGMALEARMTLFAEGCRGSLTKQLMSRFGLREGADPQTYGIGIKEVWQVAPGKERPGSVTHTVGWPMDSQTYGGSFLYHLSDGLVAAGFVVALDYKNPYLNPYREFQRWKHHPYVRGTFEGGTPLAYGARAISEGGLQSIPRLIFPGGALIGDTAGFLNTPKIKGTHNAMKSGMVAAEAAFDALTAGAAAAAPDAPIQLTDYPDRLRASWLWEDLSRARNIRPYFQYGLWAGLALSALDTYVLRGRAPWTLHHRHADHETLLPASPELKIDYPKPDGVISFDLLTSVARSNTNHEEDQPVHLQLLDPARAVDLNLAKYDGPEGRFCPAGVYEFVADADGKPRLQINAANCVHCKTCDIKDPTQNINWVPPEGGGGPLYQGM